MVLLDVVQEATEAAENAKAIGYTGLGLGGTSGIIIAIKYFFFDKKSAGENDTKHALLQQKIEQLEKDKEDIKNRLESDYVAGKVSRGNMRKKAEEDLKERTTIIHNRIDKMQLEMKNYVSTVDADMKEMRRDMVEIKTGQSSINGKLDLLLRKNGLV